MTHDKTLASAVSRGRAATLLAGCLFSVASLGACFKPPIVILDGTEPAAEAEGDRVAEALVAVLRELCRPHRLMVTESNIPFMGMLTAEMYTPRSITVTCLDGSPGRR